MIGKTAHPKSVPLLDSIHFPLDGVDHFNDRR